MLNMTHKPILTESEQKTRKQWLVIFYVILIYNTLYQFYIMNFYSDPNSFPLVSIVISFAIIVLFAVIQYHCIYRKYGTRWLTFFLYSIPIGAALSIAILYFRPAGLVKNPPILFQIIPILLAIVYWVPCYKLRKINKRIQRESNISRN